MPRISLHSPLSSTKNSLEVKLREKDKTLLIITNQWWTQAYSSQVQVSIMIGFKSKDWMHQRILEDMLQEVMSKCVSQSCKLPGRMALLASNHHRSFQATKKCVNQHTSNQLNQVHRCINHWTWVNLKIIFLKVVIQVLAFKNNKCLIKWCKIITKTRSIILP